MGFGDVSTEKGLIKLNNFLETKSYIEGYCPSIADTTVFKELSGCPDNRKYSHIARWYEHIISFGDLEMLPGNKKKFSEYGPEDEEEVDLFGSDDEEDPEEELAKAKRLEEYRAKKAKKPAEIAKSNIVLDIKPWDDETNMEELERNVRSISLDGLLWGASQLVPVGYGIKKLRITCVVEDDKVGTNDLEEAIEKDEDNVQSIDLYSFNKV